MSVTPFSFYGRYTTKKKTQWNISQPGEVFSKNQVKILIPLNLLQRGVSNRACESAVSSSKEVNVFLDFFHIDRSLNKVDSIGWEGNPLSIDIFSSYTL